MTHRIYVIGGTHEQADAYIRSMNGNIRKIIEFVNLSSIDQIRGLKRVSVVTTDGFESRPDHWEWERAFKGMRIVACELEPIYAPRR